MISKYETKKKGIDKIFLTKKRNRKQWNIRIGKMGKGKGKRRGSTGELRQKSGGGRAVRPRLKPKQPWRHPSGPTPLRYLNITHPLKLTRWQINVYQIQRRDTEMRSDVSLEMNGREVRSIPLGLPWFERPSLWSFKFNREYMLWSFKGDKSNRPNDVSKTGEGKGYRCDWSPPNAISTSDW